MTKKQSSVQGIVLYNPDRETNLPPLLLLTIEYSEELLWISRNYGMAGAGMRSTPI